MPDRILKETYSVYSVNFHFKNYELGIISNNYTNRIPYTLQSQNIVAIALEIFQFISLIGTFDVKDTHLSFISAIIII